MELIEYSEPNIKVKISCSSGTYIRTIADEIGNRIGCGAYLEKLNRTIVGRINLEQAVTIEQLIDHKKNNSIADLLIQPNMILEFTSIAVNEQFSSLVHTGPSLKPSDIVSISKDFKAGEHLLLKSTSGDLLAVGRAVISSEQLQYNDFNDELFRYDRVLL
jgi:tRNA pseudouridine55 synthase